MAQMDENMLMDPWKGGPYPIAFNLNAKILGLVYAILSAIGLLFSLIGLLGLAALSTLTTALGVTQIFALILVGALISLVGYALVAWGGYQMYQEKGEGKRWVIYGLALFVVGSLVRTVGSGFFFSLVGFIIGLVFTFIFYYLVVISRFPSEAPATSGSVSSAPPPPAPPQA